MAIRDTLAPLIQLILFIMYGAYIVLGLALMGMGIYYKTQVEGANDFVAIVCIAGGFFMLVVGGLAIFANLKSNAILMLPVLLIDLLLFVFLLAAMMIGMALATGVSDPVAQAVHTAYCDDPAEGGAYCKRTGAYDVNNKGIFVRVANWDAVLKAFGAGAPTSCVDYDASMISESLAVNAGEGECDEFVAIDPIIEEIVEVLPTAAIAEGCEVIQADQTGLTEEQIAALVTTVCTALVPAAPAGCAVPAPRDASVPSLWSASMGLKTGSCTAEADAVTGCVDTTDFTPSVVCAEAATGCELTDADTMTGTCTKILAEDAKARVLPVARQTDECPQRTPSGGSCVYTPAVVAVVGAAESCDAMRSSTDGACMGGNTVEETAACVAVTAVVDEARSDTDINAACLAVANCIYVQELTCTVTLDDTDTADTDESSAVSGICSAGCAVGVTDADCSFTNAAGVSSAGNCEYSPAVVAVDETVRTCENRGVAGQPKFPGAKAAALSDPLCTDQALCKTTAALAGNCTAIDAMFGAATSHECKRCWKQWQLIVIDKVKGNLIPATICIWALFLFVVVLVVLNYYLIDNSPVEDDEDGGGFAPGGLSKILGLVFNGIVFLFGFIVMIMGIVVQSDLNSSCPEGQECTNWQVVGVIVLGIFFFLTAILSLVGTILGGIIGKLLLRIANLIFLVLLLILMIVGVGFGIIAGALDDVNSKYDDNFEQVKQQYESKNPGLCAQMSNSQCKEKIKAKSMEGMTGLLVVLGIICFSFLFVMFLTLEAFYIYKGGGDDDGGDDGDGEE